ncbi:MAG: sulfur carrier protein ThiS [Bacteroidales bacterium]|jgi:thiamine biosynthesis protein ThiS|nr:sulfur carrier protein ThiS [Bacteroidales bacterium]
MKISLNNRSEEFDRDEMTVSEMLKIKRFTYRMRIVKINGKLIKKEDYDRAVIRDGDDVRMLYLMSGG